MTIPRIEFLPNSTGAGCVVSVMDAAGVEWTPIAHSPWEKDYPYHPLAEVRAAHTGDALLLHYRVEEETVRAMEVDNGRVWEDSCCEFFFRPQEQRLDYYNIECNAAGHLLMGYHQMDEEGRQIRAMRAEAAILGRVARWSSKGSEPFDNTPTEGEPWHLTLIIPIDALWQTPIASFDGLQAKANFYKCGDLLPKPHFLTWAPLQHPTPKFHLPQQFATIQFL